MTGSAESGRRSPRTPVENAELALLLEVAGTPKPGNVDRERDLADLRFEHFLAGAVGSGRGLQLAAAVGENPDAPGSDAPGLGEAFETAVRGMSRQSGGNTQFGCLLLLVPLVRAAARDDTPLSPDDVDAVCRATTVDDAVAFYRAFEHVDVAVGDPPADAAALDVRRGGAAEPALRERGLTLRDVLAISANTVGDGAAGDTVDDGAAGDAVTDEIPGDAADARVPDTNAREWVEGFPRTFEGTEVLRADDGPVLDRTARLFLEFLAAEPDTLVATTHGGDAAREVRERAATVREEVAETGSLAPAETLADEFVTEGVNPGTTADRTAAALFVALERGLEV